MVRVRVKASEKGAADVVTVRTAERQKADLPAPLRLVRAMRTGGALEEMRSVAIRTELYQGRDFSVAGHSMHAWNGLRGFVLVLTNRSGGPLSVDLSRFRGEGLLLIGAKEMSVGPRRSTLLFAVFEE